jgi:histidyl-tRNA synthetase
MARELRQAGLRVDVYPDPDKIGKQMKYAATRGIRHVIVAGDDERARGEVGIKDMASGEQRTVSRPLLADALRASASSPQPSKAPGAGLGPRN